MLKDKISKENFLKYIDGLRKNSEMMSKIYDASNGMVDIINLADEFNKPYRIIEKAFFTEDEDDLIGWYLYEPVDKKIYNKGCTKVLWDLKDDETLWEYLNSGVFNGEVKD